MQVRRQDRPMTLPLVLLLGLATSLPAVHARLGAPATSPDQLLGSCSMQDGQQDRLCSITGASAVRGAAVLVSANTTFRGEANGSDPIAVELGLAQLAASTSFLDISRARGALPLAPGVSLRLEHVRVKGAASESAVSLLALLAFPLGAGSRLHFRQCVVELSCSDLLEYQAHACSQSPSMDVQVSLGRLLLRRFSSAHVYAEDTLITCPGSSSITAVPCVTGVVSSADELIRALGRSVHETQDATSRTLVLMLSSPRIVFTPSTAVSAPVVDKVLISPVPGLPSPLVIDMGGREDVISLYPGAEFELRGPCVMRNLPPGSVTQFPEGLFVSLLWSFYMRGRYMVGGKASLLRLVDVTLAVPRDELAYWRLANGRRSLLLQQANYTRAEADLVVVGEFMRGLSDMQEVVELSRDAVLIPYLRITFNAKIMFQNVTLVAEDALHTHLPQLADLPTPPPRVSGLMRLGNYGHNVPLMTKQLYYTGSSCLTPMDIDSQVTVVKAQRVALGDPQPQLSTIANAQVLFVRCDFARNKGWSGYNNATSDFRHTRFGMEGWPLSIMGDPYRLHVADLRGVAAGLFLGRATNPALITLRFTTIVNAGAAASGQLAPTDLWGLYAEHLRNKAHPGTEAELAAIRDRPPMGNTYPLLKAPSDEDLADLRAWELSPQPLTNFTSCLWFFSYDRSRPPLPGQAPKVFLDSVYVHVPASELLAMRQLWQAPASAAGAASGIVKDGNVDNWLAPHVPDVQLRALLRHHLLHSQLAASNAHNLTFSRVWWCGWEGANVTLGTWAPESVAYLPQEEMEGPMLLPLHVNVQPLLSRLPTGENVSVESTGPAQPATDFFSISLRGESSNHPSHRSIATLPLVIGSVAGALVLVLAIAAVVAIIVRRRRQRGHGYRHDESPGSGASVEIGRGLPSKTMFGPGSKISSSSSSNAVVSSAVHYHPSLPVASPAAGKAPSTRGCVSSGLQSSSWRHQSEVGEMMHIHRSIWALQTFCHTKQQPDTPSDLTPSEGLSNSSLASAAAALGSGPAVQAAQAQQPLLALSPLQQQQQHQQQQQGSPMPTSNGGSAIAISSTDSSFTAASAGKMQYTPHIIPNGSPTFSLDLDGSISQLRLAQQQLHAQAYQQRLQEQRQQKQPSGSPPDAHSLPHHGDSSQQAAAEAPTEAPVGASRDPEPSCGLGHEPLLVIEGPLGRGGNAAVYKATWRGLPVAVKSILFVAQQPSSSVAGGAASGSSGVSRCTSHIRTSHPSESSAKSISSWSFSDVCIKLPTNALLPVLDPCVPVRVANELAIAVSLQHPNLLQTYHWHLAPMAAEGEVMAQDATPAVPSTGVQCWRLDMIQELCTGGSLLQALNSGRVSALPLVRRVCLALDIAYGLYHLHSKGVVHGDLSASNVLLTHHCQRAKGHLQEQEQEREASASTSTSDAWVVEAVADDSLVGSEIGTAKICDFGSSLHLQAHETHISDVVFGTPQYTAPELQATGRAAYASDVYSYGCLLWELAAGTAERSGGGSGSAAFPCWALGVPDQYLQLGQACMHEDPALRPELKVIILRLIGMSSMN